MNNLPFTVKNYETSILSMFCVFLNNYKFALYSMGVYLENLPCDPATTFALIFHTKSEYLI